MAAFWILTTYLFVALVLGAVTFGVLRMFSAARFR